MVRTQSIPVFLRANESPFYFFRGCEFVLKASNALSAVYLLGLPQIRSINELSQKINLTERRLYHISYRSDYFYKEVIIKKKSGKGRILSCPSQELKAVQAWILRNILEPLPIHNSATAFKRGSNVLENAKKHSGNNYFLCLDIKDFFPSIPKKHVFNLFRSLGYNDHIALVLANFCTYKNSLPQGGVTSPVLSNLISMRLDRRIAGYASKKNFIYTRYADDITLSSRNPDKLMRSKRVIESIIQDEGYQINSDKTRLLRPGKHRILTGVVVSETGNLGIGKVQKRLIRAKIHRLETNEYKDKEYTKQLRHIVGWLSYMKSIDSLDNVNKLYSYWDKLISQKTHDQVAVAEDEK